MSRRRRPAPPAAEERVVSRLRELEREREPFRELTRRLLQTAFERFPLPDTGPIVEIGAGIGELYSLLPDSVRARWVLTEPSELGRAQLSRRFPGQRVERASVEQLPFADGEVAAVVGLCVLDLVTDLAPARAELSRVLADDGLVLHLLDQSPHLAGVLERLAPLDLVVLPNVFGDPSQQRFPEDLCVFEAGQLTELSRLLQRHGQALGAPLARYVQLFVEKPWQLARALAELDHLASSDERRGLLRHAFEAAPELASAAERAGLGDLRGHLVSSSQDLAGRLERELSSSELRTLYNNLSFACELAAARGDAAYRSLSVGQHRTLSVAPEKTLVEGAPRPAVDQQLRELGLHVFVARRSPRRPRPTSTSCSR